MGDPNVNLVRQVDTDHTLDVFAGAADIKRVSSPESRVVRRIFRQDVDCEIAILSQAVGTDAKRIGRTGIGLDVRSSERLAEGNKGVAFEFVERELEKPCIGKRASQGHRTSRGHRKAADKVRRSHVRPQVRILNGFRVLQVIPIDPTSRPLKQSVVPVPLIGANGAFQ